MKKFISILLLAFVIMPAFSLEKGIVKTFVSDKGARLLSLSDNGYYAVGSGVDANGQPTYPFIWDVRNDKQLYLSENGSDEPATFAAAWDVSDDGKKIVGAYKGLPAMFNIDTNEWIMLPLPSDDYVSGVCHKISSDGKYIIGTAFTVGDGMAVPCLWENEKLIEVTLPEKNLYGGISVMNCFDAMSSDCSVITGRMSYVTPEASSAFIYKPETKEFEYIAPEVMTEKDPGGFILDNHIEDNVISPNGKFIGGIYHCADYTGDPDNYDFFAVSECFTCFNYNVGDKEFTNLYDVDSNFEELGISAIDDEGVSYAFSPINYPIRMAYVIKDKQSISLDVYARDNFNIDDLLGETGFSQTGTIMGVSSDGSVIGAMADMAGRNYIIAKSGVLTGIENTKVSNMAVNVYGNTLYLKGDVASVNIVDVAGRIVADINNPSESINVNNGNGLYIITMKDAYGNQKVQKVVIKY